MICYFFHVVCVFFILMCIFFFFFFKQKTAYEMRISDWSSDVCSSDLLTIIGAAVEDIRIEGGQVRGVVTGNGDVYAAPKVILTTGTRSEEHTSELQSLMRISYAVFCLKKKKEQRLLLITAIIKASHHVPHS